MTRYHEYKDCVLLKEDGEFVLYVDAEEEIRKAREEEREIFKLLSKASHAIAVAREREEIIKELSNIVHWNKDQSAALAFRNGIDAAISSIRSRGEEKPLCTCDAPMCVARREQSKKPGKIARLDDCEKNSFRITGKINELIDRENARGH
jgi:hypothetical protein